MARDPRWIAHRFGETLTVRVGSFLSPAQFRVSAALEPELRSWFRRRRLQGWAVAVPLLIAGEIAAIGYSLSLLLTIAFMAVVFGWPVLSGNTPERFLRKYPQARRVGPSGQPVEGIQGGVVYETNEDGTIDVKGLSASGPSFRIRAEHASQLRPWYRQTHMLAWAIMIPWLVLFFWVNASERFSPDQKTWLTVVLWISAVGLVLLVGKWQFRRFFPDAQRLPGRKNFLATQAEHPVYRAHMIPLLIGSLLLDALVIWGVSLKPEIAVGDIVVLVCALGASAYLFSIAVYQLTSRTRNRTGAPD
jgi:hypothetical protein